MCFQEYSSVKKPRVSQATPASANREYTVDHVPRSRTGIHGTPKFYERLENLGSAEIKKRERIEEKADLEAKIRRLEAEKEAERNKMELQIQKLVHEAEVEKTQRALRESKLRERFVTKKLQLYVSGGHLEDESDSSS